MAAISTSTWSGLTEAGIPLYSWQAGEQLTVWETGSSKLGGAGCPVHVALPAADARTLDPRFSDGTGGVTAKSSRVIVT